jgi:O-antigen/teichoic acid export membrane protein
MAYSETICYDLRATYRAFLNYRDHTSVQVSRLRRLRVVVQVVACFAAQPQRILVYCPAVQKARAHLNSVIDAINKGMVARVEGKMYLLHSRRLAIKQIIPRQSWFAGIACCCTVVALCNWIVVARTLDPGIFGIYIFVQWIAGVAIPFVGVGTSMLTSSRIARIQGRETPRVIAGIFYFLWYRQCRCILIYCLVYLLLTYPLFAIFGICSPMLSLLAGLTILPLLLSSIAGATLRSLRRIDLLITLQLLGALLNLLLALIATQLHGYQVGIFLLTRALASTLTLIMGIICITRLLPMHIAIHPGNSVKERLLHGLHCSFRPFLLDTIVWQHSEILLLSLWHRPTTIGFYAISAMCSCGMLKFAPSLYSSWITPLLRHYFPQRHYLNAYDAFLKHSCYLTFIAAPASIAIMLFSSTIITASLGSSYLPLIGPLRILLISAVFGSIATVSLSYLTDKESTRALLRLNTGAACTNIILAVPLVALWDMNGAAFASCCAQMISAVGSIVLCRNLLKRNAHQQQKENH